MIAVSEILAECAREAGIKVPENLDEYDPNDFPHWHVYHSVQFGQPMPHWSAHRDNAKVVADVPESMIRIIKLSALIERGLAVGHSK